MTLERPCVLVCDDEKAARRGVTRALGTGKYDLVECENGQQCLSVLSERSVDLVQNAEWTGARFKNGEQEGHGGQRALTS